jgi:hypothetical protein
MPHSYGSYFPPSGLRRYRMKEMNTRRATEKTIDTMKNKKKYQ